MSLSSQCLYASMSLKRCGRLLLFSRVWFMSLVLVSWEGCDASPRCDEVRVFFWEGEVGSRIIGESFEQNQKFKRIQG